MLVPEILLKDKTDLQEQQFSQTVQHNEALPNVTNITKTKAKGTVTLTMPHR